MADTIIVKRSNTAPVALNPGRLFVDLDDEVLYFGATSGPIACATTAVVAAGYQPLDTDLTSWAAITRASGFDTFVATPSSANLKSLVTDETGSGALVFATSPTLVTPVLGVASATSINKVALTAPATGSTITVADGKTLTASNTITLTATDGSTLGIGGGGTLGSMAYQNASSVAITGGSLVNLSSLTLYSGFAHTIFYSPTSSGSTGVYFGLDGGDDFDVHQRVSNKGIRFKVDNVIMWSMTADGVRWSTQSSSSSSFSMNRDATVVFCTGTGSTTQAVDIPSTVISQTGRIIYVIDAGAAAATRNITITTQGSETIDGAATSVINTNRGVKRLVSNGSNLFTF